MCAERNDLFLRKSEDSASEDIENKWDDQFLIKAYNKAVYKARQEILKKIQQEDGLTNDEIKGVISEENSECSIEPSKSSKKRNKKISNSKYEKRRISKITHWNIGDFCRAVYSEDGEEYEAQIKRKIDGNWCVVKFIGYNNEEEVLLNEIMPSMGKKIRKIQLETAENDLKMKFGSEELKTDGSDEMMSEGECDDEPKRYPDFAGLHSTRSYQPTLPPPPPPPPMPPSVLNGCHPPIGSLFPHPRSTDTNMDSLLMSWYMCGYYTGYYAREMKN